MRELTIIPGDGIGPEVMDSTLEVLKAAGAQFQYDLQSAGEAALKSHGSLLPESTLASLRRTGLALKGPTTTPVGGGHKSINVTLRQAFDLFANIRPVKSPPGLKTLNPKTRLTIVRENTEDLYMGIERMIDDDTAESIKRITRKGSERIARRGFELARQQGYKKVAIVHKANIMKMTDGLFLKTCRDVASSYPDIECTDVIVDNCCMQLVTKPEQFQVIITENLYGDILSDLCAGLVGGLGIVPGANIGDGVAVFEAVHGSAPDIAGQGKANPTALIQSAVLMLQHLGDAKRAERIESALFSALQDSSCCTGDLGGKGSTRLFTQAIVAKLTA
jgi:isocitrate dehydrogenase (NAD+)